MRFARLVEASAAAAATRSRHAKLAALAGALRGLAPDEVAFAVDALSGETGGAPAGVGFATLRSAVREVAPADAPGLEIADVDRAIAALATLRGRGSAAARGEALRALFARATEAEQDFLARLLLGELRQGALAGLVLEAVALAASVPAAALRRAAMLGGSLSAAARAAFAGGEAALVAVRLELLRPIQPMLAQSAEDVPDALARLGRAAFEWKLDGARIQVHRRDDEVRVFSRLLNDVTVAVPEVVTAARRLACRSFVLDGEAIALRPDRRPHAFQDTMRRFGRKRAAAEMEAELPLHVFFFDVLHAEGDDWLTRPDAERRERLEALVPEPLRVPRLVTDETAAAERFFAGALTAGHEGLVAKALAAPYEAGRRGAAWLKLKREHTLDLVVLAVEQGSGRRSAWLSNLHLGARDPATGGFVMLGKTFKGMSDEMLAWQTERLGALALRREGHVVHVRPELVVEVAFDGVQASRQYPGGVALRFARVKRYRPDKRPEDADTIEAVRALHARDGVRPG